MKHWLILVSNADDYGFKEWLPRIKALRPILVDLGIGALKEAKEFVCGEKALKATRPSQASKIIAFCDKWGLTFTIFTVVTRLITPTEYRRLEEG